MPNTVNWIPESSLEVEGTGEQENIEQAHDAELTNMDEKLLGPLRVQRFVIATEELAWETWTYKGQTWDSRTGGTEADAFAAWDAWQPPQPE